jgi:hypothetical protein
MNEPQKILMQLSLIVGFLTVFLGNLMLDGLILKDVSSYLARVIWLLGVGIWIYGCMLYVQNKGYHKIFGLLGSTIILPSALPLIGLVALVILPKRNKVVENKNIPE